LNSFLAKSFHIIERFFGNKTVEEEKAKWFAALN